MARPVSKAMALTSLALGILHPTLLLVGTPFMYALTATMGNAAAIGIKDGEKMFLSLIVLFAIVVLFAPAGLALGIISRIRLSKVNQKTGMATAGMVLGIINVSILAMIVAVLALVAKGLEAQERQIQQQTDKHQSVPKSGAPRCPSGHRIMSVVQVEGYPTGDEHLRCPFAYALSQVK